MTHHLAGKFSDKLIPEYGSAVYRNMETKIMGRAHYLADSDERKKIHDLGAHVIRYPEAVGKVARCPSEIMVVEKLPLDSVKEEIDG